MIYKYKARRVTKEFKQKEGLDFFGRYPSMTKITSIIVLIAIAALYNLEIHQINVTAAFLNSELEQEIYMKQPKRFIALGQEKKCVVSLSLYTN